jgi:hypothetical protein
MYIPMPSPRGTNKAGLFIPASRFGAAAAAYDERRGLQRYGRDQNDERRDDDTNGEHPAHEVLRRARKSLTTAECEPLRALLGRLLMAEKEDADADDDEEEADGRTGTPDAGYENTGREPPSADKRKMGRDEPRPGGEVDPIVKRAQDAARQHYLAYDAKRRKKGQLAAAEEMASIPLPRNISVRYAPAPPRLATDAASAADFAARHPEVARIKVI